eukprot:3075197-Pleurochrysis_carterae.AAC.1
MRWVSASRSASLNLAPGTCAAAAATRVRSGNDVQRLRTRSVTNTSAPGPDVRINNGQPLSRCG